MNHRERAAAALNFRPVDRVAMDLDGMGSSSISAFAYPKLVEALGLPPRLPKLFDTYQMLALVDLDVIEALGCDFVAVHGDLCSNAFEEPEKWHYYDFNGRLPALVLHPEKYAAQPDGSILQNGEWTMPVGGYVFNEPHAGQQVDIHGDPLKPDLDAIAAGEVLYTPEWAAGVAERCRRAGAAGSGHAVVYNGLSAGLGFYGGMANFSMLALLEPEFVKAYHQLLIDQAVRKARVLVPAIAPYVEVMTLCSDDQGTQVSTILPPEVYRELFVPYYRRLNDEIHRLAPGIKTFYHSCGAIYPILDAIVEAGFDVLNPVQWSAGQATPEEWRRKAAGRLVLWGGGVDTQHVLPAGSLEEVAAQVRAMVRLFGAGSGYVFCAIHNLLAEIPPEKIIALYREAARIRFQPGRGSE